jgi:hypothetical protein
VYDADGSVRGELAYFVGARLGRAHCSLCDITHGFIRERSEWTAWRESLPVTFETFHRDDQPNEVRAAQGDRAPAVLAETDAGLTVLLGPDELELCSGSVEEFSDAINSALGRTGLSWPA